MPWQPPKAHLPMLVTPGGILLIVMPVCVKASFPDADQALWESIQGKSNAPTECSNLHGNLDAGQPPWEGSEFGPCLNSLLSRCERGNHNRCQAAREPELDFLVRAAIRRKSTERLACSAILVTPSMCVAISCCASSFVNTVICRAPVA